MTAVLIAPGVRQLDTLLGGWEHVTAGYLIDGEAPLLIETGSQSSAPSLIATLDSCGIGPQDLAGVVVTHIHLDHAGGVGELAAAFPKAKIYVHEKGARHLADPSRLIASAELVFGSLLDTLYGRMTPTASNRIHAVNDGDVISVGSDRAVRVLYTPGHAKHHIALHDSGSGIVFVGDAMGVRLPDMDAIRPATPPPDFDLELAVGSLARIAEVDPTGVAMTHWGLFKDPASALSEADERLHAWARVAQVAVAANANVEAALRQVFCSDHIHERLEKLNGVVSNAAGLERWLRASDDASSQ